MCFTCVVLALLLNFTDAKDSWEQPGLNRGPLATKARITLLDHHYPSDNLEQKQVQIATPSLDY